MGPWLQFTDTLDKPVLVNFALVTRIEPDSGFLSNKDRCCIHFGPGEAETSVVVKNSYDDVTAQLQAALHPAATHL